MTDVKIDKHSVKKRLDRFFSKDAPNERRPVTSFLNELEECARVFIFGGLVRDVCLKSTRQFRSDVDVVVKVNDHTKFEATLAKYDYKKNKFGGYRIQNSRWYFDLWEFDKTWAFSEGYVAPENEESLLETTFFNWDAAFYDWQEKQLRYKANYFEDLKEKVLDINLTKNPNELGAFLRSLRLIVKEQAKTKETLTTFINFYLEKHVDEDILAYEKNHFSNAVLNLKKLRELRNRCAHWQGEQVFEWMNDNQLDLFSRTEH